MQADRSRGASEGGRPSPSRSKASWLLGENYSRPERRTLVLLAATLALASANAATIGAVAPEVRRAFDVDNTAIGVLASSATAAAAVATVPFGILVDRWDRTKLLAICTVLAGVATMLSSVAGSFAFLFVTRVALGALTGAAGPGVASLLGDTFHESRRGRSYSTVLAGELLGAGAGFAVAGELAALDWRLSFIALAPPAFLLAWFLWRLPEPLRGRTVSSPGGGPIEGLATEGAPDHERPAAPEFPREEVLASWRQLSLRRTVVYVLSVPTFVIFVFSGACTYFYFAGLRTFGVEYASDQYHVSQAVATAMFLLVGTGGLAGVLASGRIGDVLERYHPAGRVLVSAIALFGAAAAFVPAVLSSSYVVGLPLMTVGAFGLAAAIPPVSAGRLQVMPPGLWGRAEGIQGVLRQVGDAMGPVAFGFAGDRLSGGGRAGLQSSFLVMLVSLVAAGAVLLLALRTYPADVEGARVAASRPPGRS
jgi:predicted MFS family arabinose efflux permease